MLLTTWCSNEKLPTVGTGALARPGGARLRYSLLLLFSITAFTQEQAPPKDPSQPQVRVNILNVCTPSAEEQQEIRNALAHVPPPKFAPDFEVSRGLTSVPDAPNASYVRVRHEFGPAVPFIAAQYSLSVDEKSIIEDLVFRTRDPKDLIQIQLEDTVTGTSDAKTVLATDTPVSRIKLERFGKSSVGLSRCPAADQAVYEPLFQQASAIMSRYRMAMGTKRVVPRELSLLGVLPSEKKPGAKATEPKKKQ